MTSKKPLVSVIIRTHGNRNNFLTEAINSVINQTYKNIEIIVIEDGSEFAKSLNLPIIYRSIPKSGRCGAGNFGLSIAKGEYINFLDDDDFFYKEHIELLLKELLDNDSIDAVYGSTIEEEIQILNSGDYERRHQSIQIAHKFSKIILFHHNFMPIQSILFRRRLYDKFGGFDLSLDALEDWDLWLRYSLNNQFKPINCITSVYRLPCETEKKEKRAKTLAKYYPIVKAKHEQMFIEKISITSIIEYCKEYADYFRPLPQPNRLKCKILENPVLYKLYKLASKLI